MVLINTIRYINNINLNRCLLDKIIVYIIFSQLFHETYGNLKKDKKCDRIIKYNNQMLYLSC